MKKVLMSMMLVILTLCLFISCSSSPSSRNKPQKEKEFFLGLAGKYMVGTDSLEEGTNKVKLGMGKTYTLFEEYKGYAFGTSYVNDEEEVCVSSYDGYFSLGDYYYTIPCYPKDTENKDFIVQVFEKIKEKGGLDDISEIDAIMLEIDPGIRFIPCRMVEIVWDKTDEGKITYILNPTMPEESTAFIFDTIELETKE